MLRTARTMLSQDVLYVRLSVSLCPSIRLSHASIVSKRLNIIIKLFHHSILVFFLSNVIAILRRPPLTRASNAGVREKSRFSTNISLYLGNDTDRAILIWNANRNPNATIEWVLMTLSDLTKYSMTRSIARSLCDTLAARENRCRVYAFDNDFCIKYRFTDATIQKIVQ